MDNPNVVLDDDDLSEEEPGETIRLRPYLDWRVSANTTSTAKPIQMPDPELTADSLLDNYL